MNEAKEPTGTGTTGPSNDRCPANRPHSRRVRFGVAAAALIGLGALIGVLGTTALEAAAIGGGFHGHRGGMHPERMLERVERKVSWALASVDATAEQEEQVMAIVDDAIERLAPMRNEHRDARHEFMTELVRTDIDRTKLEQLRQQHLAMHDMTSAIVVDAVVQAAEVLTPEQREELISKHRRYRH